MTDPPAQAPASAPPGPGGGSAMIGPWRVQRALAPGVHAATSPAGDPVVVKVATAAEPSAGTVRAEAAALRVLGSPVHPAVVASAGSWEGDGLVAVATRLVDGPALDRAIAGRALSLGAAARLLVGVADALAAIHAAGWVHGDVSAANVVLGPAGAVLVDLGSAHPAEVPGVATGSPGVTAPEVRAGGSTTTASDVWSLAAVVAAEAAGAHPTTGAPAALRASLSADPSARPPAAALAEALRDLAGLAAIADEAGLGSSIPAPLVGPALRPARTTIQFGPRPPTALPPAPTPVRSPLVLAAAAGTVAAAVVGWRLAAESPPRPAPVPVTGCAPVAGAAGGCGEVAVR